MSEATDDIDAAEIWYAYCAETPQSRRWPQGALAFGVDAVLKSPFVNNIERLTAENAGLLAERDGLKEALDHLIRCGNAVIGADIQDPDAAEAFEMYNDSRAKARKAIAALATSSDADADNNTGGVT